MMADTDLIARLYPCTDKFGYARYAIEHSSQHQPARSSRTTDLDAKWNRGDRESTEPPEVTHGDEDLPCIELRFSSPPPDSRGFTCGSSDTCCFHTPLQGVSRFHCALTYKQIGGRYYLIVRDLNSSYGTKVTYDKKGDELRRKFDWIIGGHKYPQNLKPVIIRLTRNLYFRVVVTDQDTTSPTYVTNVERFLQGSADADALLGGLEIQSGLPTILNSLPQSPTAKPILIDLARLGHGSFGMVTRMWNVSTGEEYARKRPISEKEYNKEGWEKEIDLMRLVKHENIVQLLGWCKTPVPSLYLEYIPFGNLKQQSKYVRFSYAECCQINYQSLLALDYLHGEGIVHRDIKPTNILVQYRDFEPNGASLRVKLSDFGLSKQGTLKTFCGSGTYLAPEIPFKNEENYTDVVDIWSLGVVILEYAYGLPQLSEHDAKKCTEFEWCQKVVKEVNEWEPEGLITLLQRMLVINPRVRPAAAHMIQEASDLLTTEDDQASTPTPIIQEASNLLATEDDRASTPTPISYAAEIAIATVEANQQHEEDRLEDQGTIDILPNRISDASVESRRLRSIVPTPSSSKKYVDNKGKRKRSEPSSPSSSQTKRHKKHAHSNQQPSVIKSKEESYQDDQDHEEQSYQDNLESYHKKLFDPMHPLGGGSALMDMLGLGSSAQDRLLSESSTSQMLPSTADPRDPASTSSVILRPDWMPTPHGSIRAHDEQQLPSTDWERHSDAGRGTPTQADFVQSSAPGTTTTTTTGQDADNDARAAAELFVELRDWHA